MSEVNEILGAMLGIFGDGEGWCQGAHAKNLNGQACYVNSRQARQFCLIGALNRAAEGKEHAFFAQAYTRLVNTCGSDRITIWNDQQANYGAVKAMVRAALEDGK